MNTKILGVIPARFASSRFPGKPLIDIHGRSMIEWVYKRACQAHLLSEVIVATDDNRIYRHVKQFGGKVEMTSENHQSGTERIAEVAERHASFGSIINIQGDEPFIEPEAINEVCRGLTARKLKSIFTLINPISQLKDLESQHIVKAVVDKNWKSLYFSRYAIPFDRKAAGLAEKLASHTYYRHIGIYGFPREILLSIPHLSPSSLEKVESLEQLRWLYHGYEIYTSVFNDLSPSIDTPEDLEKILSLPIPDNL